MMVTYLLLRDNKERGPYSFDELVGNGLKPYDLIWVQGKSAAWRYPSEIPELAAYAPIVEEQPYDRFFKKDEPQEHFAFKDTPDPTPVKKVETKTPDKHEAYKPKPSVFVTMPNSGTEKTIPSTPSTKLPETSKETIQPTIVVTENPAAAQIKYSQPLDEIKEMYVKTLQERKQKIAFRSLAIQSLKKASVILLFVGAGVVAGFMIRTNKDENSIVKSSVANEPRQEVLAAETNLPDVNEFNLHAGDELLNNSSLSDERPTNEIITRRDDQPQPKSSNDPAKQLLSSERPLPQKEPTAGYQFESTEIDSRSGERKSKSRDNGDGGNQVLVQKEATEKTQTESHKKSAVFSDVSVSSNDYRIVAFGGIRDLQLTVTNDSEFPLDEVIVELQYLKPSEQPLRTENIRFKAIAPNTSSTIKIPDTNRGIKVTYRILSVRSDAAEKSKM